VDELPDDVSLPVKIALYRILQEALSNAYRHAGANRQWVRLWGEGDIICLEVEDQGKGFEPPPLEGPQATERVEHIGLRGMRDRVALLGGTFQLFSQPGKGTRITVKVPIHV
jgi:signal transduction histidine kinase